MKNLLLLIAIVSLNLDVTKPKSFPKLNHYTVDGKLIINDYFNENEKTLVIHGFIGCQPTMNVLKDLQTLENRDTSLPKILVIFENSINQFHNFNDTIVTPLSKLREHYELKPITFDVIAECGISKVSSKSIDFEIGSECRKLGRKLRTKSSPTLFLVDSNGKIIKKFKGYFSKPNPNRLLDFLNK